MAEFEVNSKPFDEHELVDDVIEADDPFMAALMFARDIRGNGPVEVYVRELGSAGKPETFTVRTAWRPAPDVLHVEAVAFNLHQAAFFAHRPDVQSHVLAKSYMTLAFQRGGRIVDFETRVRAVQLLIHFDLFVADCIKERCHARN